ncbi:PQQ-dependent sugar dehydrogenase [Oceanobacillus polygoni]|uniref:PQQ-dependent sugar dehydrogenase n=1 Tax=Oceanobacillus polygoni TaxID=1235259 RepID=UPI002482F16B|nr:PQQ-dependent sugar dehydrogenase [Oceanobacillus polygoni]
MAGCATDNNDTPVDDSTEEEQEDTEQAVPGDEREVLADNLEAPWAIAKAGDTFYISERTGSIVTIDGEEQSRKAVQLEKEISEEAEAGLLGIVIPEDFSDTNEAYAYYSYQEEGETYQRVVSIEEQDDNWVETAVLLDEIPGGSFHHGGRMEIGPDDKLYVTTGDASIPELAQDRDSLAGNILRLNLDGTIPEDNPIENSYVFSYGHRNPQGLAWSPEGELFATEHGNQAHDEVNQILPGANYGWPVIEGDETEDGMEVPLIHSGDETWAPSGIDHYEGNFYFASLRGEGLRKFDPVNETEELIIYDVGRVRDVLAAENGLYMITNNTDGRGDPTEDDDRLLFIPIPENQLH